MLNGVRELNVEHVLMLAIVALALYHFMGSCGCRGNGFSVGVSENLENKCNEIKLWNKCNCNTSNSRATRRNHYTDRYGHYDTDHDPWGDEEEYCCGWAGPGLSRNFDTIDPTNKKMTEYICKSWKDDWIMDPSEPCMGYSCPNS